MAERNNNNGYEEHVMSVVGEARFARSGYLNVHSGFGEAVDFYALRQQVEDVLEKNQVCDVEFQLRDMVTGRPVESVNQATRPEVVHPVLVYRDFVNGK